MREVILNNDLLSTFEWYKKLRRNANVTDEIDVKFKNFICTEFDENDVSKGFLETFRHRDIYFYLKNGEPLGKSEHWLKKLIKDIFGYYKMNGLEMTYLKVYSKVSKS